MLNKMLFMDLLYPEHDQPSLPPPLPPKSKLSPSLPRTTCWFEFLPSSPCSSHNDPFKTIQIIVLLCSKPSNSCPSHFEKNKIVPTIAEGATDPEPSNLTNSLPLLILLSDARGQKLFSVLLWQSNFNFPLNCSFFPFDSLLKFKCYFIRKVISLSSILFFSFPALQFLESVITWNIYVSLLTRMWVGGRV